MFPVCQLPLFPPQLFYCRQVVFHPSTSLSPPTRSLSVSARRPSNTRCRSLPLLSPSTRTFALPTRLPTLRNATRGTPRLSAASAFPFDGFAEISSTRSPTVVLLGAEVLRRDDRLHYATCGYWGATWVGIDRGLGITKKIDRLNRTTSTFM